ncbi:DUF3667 domain-containing protein [Flavisolibacter sp. BT320]|nr:DUF3667 domain-containing protein [Flavisolibacter longurius]
MSHQPERKEKDCLNCGAQVAGRYCHRCGQENVVTHQSFWSLTKHFVYDILHFDGKFFHTIGYIFSRPGFVPRQYAEGKRMRYLDPVRMYLFTSAVFFLVFFSFDSIKLNNNGLSGKLDNDDRIELIEDYEKRIQKNPADSFLQARITLLKDTTQPIDLDALGWWENESFIGNKSYASVQEYDSIQKALPPVQKDGTVERFFNRKGIELNKQYGSGGKVVHAFWDTFLHQLPYLLFVSLPFFALLLKLLYIRRKNFYYSDHAVFTLYHYIFSFILLLMIFALTAIGDWSGWGIFWFLRAIVIMAFPVYLYIEMKNFYRQGKLKTLGKFLLLNFMGMFVLFLLFILFLVFSLFKL